MIRLRINQERHDAEVLRVVRMLPGLGWTTIYADLSGLAKPPMIGGYVPDIYAHDGRAEYVAEVETIDSVNIPESLRQFSAFQGWATIKPGTRKLQKFVV